MTIIAASDDWSRVSHTREKRDWSKVSPREKLDWSKVSPREKRDWSKVSPREKRDWSKVSPREKRDWLMWAYFGLTLAQSVECSRRKREVVGLMPVLSKLYPVLLRSLP